MQLDPASAIPTLLQILQNKEKYNTTIRVWAAGPLARAGGGRGATDPLLVDLLHEVLEKKPSGFELGSVVNTIGHVGAVEAMPQGTLAT